MRLIGCVLLVLSVGWMGALYASALKRRPRTLLALADSLAVLQNEICTRLAPLSYALERAAAVSDLTSQYYFCLITGLESQLSFPELWASAVRCVPSLRPEDRQALFPLGMQLGRYDAETQSETLSCCIQTLRSHAAGCRESVRSGARLSVGLGFAGGLLLAVTFY